MTSGFLLNIQSNPEFVLSPSDSERQEVKDQQIILQQKEELAEVLEEELGHKTQSHKEEIRGLILEHQEMVQMAAQYQSTLSDLISQTRLSQDV